MTSTIRSFAAAGMLLGACALTMPASSAEAQGKSGKSKCKKVQKQTGKATRKTTLKTTRTVSRRIGTGEDWRRDRVLCEDGTWMLRSSNTCSSHGGIASH